MLNAKYAIQKSDRQVVSQLCLTLESRDMVDYQWLKICNGADHTGSARSPLY